MARKCWSIFLCLLIYRFLLGQCPEQRMLWQRISYLKNNSIPADQQLHELLITQSKMDSANCPHDSTYCYLLQRIGVMYFLKNNYTAAADITQKAVSLLNSSKTRASSANRLIECYENLKFYYDSLHLTAKKNEAIDSCISIGVRSHQVNETILQSLASKVRYLLYIGDYLECIAYAELGEQLAKNQHLAGNEVVKELFGWKTNALLLLYRYDAAGSSIKQKIDEEHKLSKDNKYLGNLYSLYAKYFEGKQQPDSALLNLRRSFTISRKLKQPEGCASALGEIGFLYLDRLHDYNRSAQYFREALTYADATESINILDNIGNACLKKGQYDSAFFYFQQAFDQIIPGMNETSLLSVSQNLLTSNKTEYLITLILDKADAYFDKYRHTGNPADAAIAAGIFVSADKLLNKIKLEQTEDQSKLFWRTNSRRLYEHAINLCMLSRNTASGFYFFEKSKAVLLTDQLRAQRWMNDEETLQLALLNQKKAEAETKLAAGTNDAQTVSAANELLTITNDLAKRRTTIRSNNPLYYQSLIDSNFQTLRQFQTSIQKTDQSLVELFVGDSAVFILVISANHSQITSVEKNEFTRLTKETLDYISNESRINENFKAFTAVSAQLYQLLFKNNPLPLGRLIISPDGPVFPFEVLVTSNQGREPQYLFMQHPVSYAYSARYLQINFLPSGARQDGDLLGIAPIEFKPDDSLVPLRGSAESMAVINSFFIHYRNQFFSEATRNHFLQQFPTYKIIQLYTHASGDDDEKGPVIYFSDSALYLSDLSAKKKPIAQLVVLSACETAKGKLYQGEGVFSFNRGFATLGIPSCVSNIWSVNNMATYRLTEMFYKQLASGLPLDIALQHAKLEYYRTGEKNQLPYYWGSMILVGKPDPVHIDHVSAWNYFLTIIFLLLFFALLLVLIINRKRLRENLANV